MEFDLVKIFHEMGVFQMAIVGTLGLMAVSSLAVFVERLWVFRQSGRRSAQFAAAARPVLDGYELGRFADLARDAEGSHLARLLGSGMNTYLAATKRPGGAIGPVELARRELLRQTEAANAELRRGMGVLASVGSIGPFVGLLGTVMGIIASFQGIAKEGAGGLGSVSAGIAEALVVTAIGLLVAIPAVLAFNFLTSRCDALLLALEQARGEFIDHLEAAPPISTGAQVVNGAHRAHEPLRVGMELGEANARA